MSTPRSLSFRNDEEARSVLYRWYKSLQEHDRGGRAQLRRISKPEDAVFVPAFHRLLAGLEEAGFDVSKPWTRERLAAVAALAARVEEPGDPEQRKLSVAARFGTPGKKRTEPPVSRLRFSRLVAQETLANLYTPLARALPLVDNRVHLASLADSILYWNDDMRRRWAYDYFQAAPQRTRPS